MKVLEIKFKKQTGEDYYRIYFCQGFFEQYKGKTAAISQSMEYLKQLYPDAKITI